MKPIEDCGRNTGVGGGPRDDFLEQIRGHPARAGERGEHPARAQQLQRVEVDVLVGARGRRGVSLGGRELRRVEYDEVEAAALRSRVAQVTEYVGLDPFGARRIETVCLGIAAREFERGA